jgi:predicted Zn-dependent protease
MRGRGVAVCLLACVTAFATSIQAYNVEWRSFLSWNNAAHWPEFPVRYIIRSETIPQSWRDGVEAMMREWEWPTNRDEDNIAWWSRRFNTTRWRPEQDGDNHITWIWQRDNYRDVRGVDDATAATILGTERTYFSWSSPWHITESDVFFNAAYFSWTTNPGNTCGSGNVMLVQHIALHELGHMLGLQHSGVGTAIMAATTSCGDTRQILQRDDINGLDYLYEADDPIHGYDPW